MSSPSSANGTTRCSSPKSTTDARPVTRGRRIAGASTRRPPPAAPATSPRPTSSRLPVPTPWLNVRKSTSPCVTVTKISRTRSTPNQSSHHTTSERRAIAIAPTSEPATTAPSGVTDLRSPATILGRVARYPARSGGMTSRIRLKVIVPTISRSSNRSNRPASARYTATIPVIKPVRTSERRSTGAITRALAAPSDLLRLAGPQDPAGAEDQDEDQDEERERVLQLERRRDVVPGEDQRRTERLEEPEREPAERRARDAADPTEDRRRERRDPG